MPERIVYQFEFVPDRADAVHVEAEDGSWTLESVGEGLRLTHQVHARQQDVWTFRASGLAWFRVSRLTIPEAERTEDGITTTGAIPQP